MASNRGHRDRTTRHADGEAYVRRYKCEKWIRQCVVCQDRGYDPEMPDDVTADRSGHLHWNIRRYFRPLRVDKNGLCDNCGGKTDEP